MNQINPVSDKRATAIFGLGLLAALSLYYLPWLTGKSYYLSDICFYFEPLAKYVADSLRQGKIPLWNNLSYCGMPQIAIPSPGIFHPFTLLFVILPFSQALAVIMLTNQLIAGLGSYLLVTRLSWGNWAGCVAGIIFSLSGFMFSLQTQYTIVASAAWLPLCLFALVSIDGSSKGKTVTNTLLLSISVFMLLSAGRPEISGPSLIILFACSLALAFSDKTPVSIPIVRVAAIIAGIFLAAPELLPALEWRDLSRRAVGLRNETIFIWSAHWYDLLGLVLANPLGNLNTLGAKFLPLVSAMPGYRATPFLSSLLVGPVAITLALWGACDTTFRQRFTIIGLMVLGIILAMGDQTPFGPLLVGWFPQLAQFRFPIKLMFIPIGCISLLAARGIYAHIHLQEHRNPSSLSQIIGWAFWLIAALTGAFLIGSSASHTAQGELIGQAKYLIGQSLLAASAIGFLIQLFSFKGKSQWIILLLLATLLIPAFQFSRFAGDSEFYSSKNNLADRLGRLRQATLKQQLPRVAILYGHPALSLPWGLKDRRDLSMENYLSYGRQMLMPNSNMDASCPSLFAFEGAETGTFHELAETSLLQSGEVLSMIWPKNDQQLSTFCRLNACAYAITHIYYIDAQTKAIIFLPPLDPSMYELVDQDWKLNFRIYRVVNSLDRARFTEVWSNQLNDAVASDQINHADASNFDPERVTLIPTMEMPSLESKKSIVWLLDEPNQMKIKVSTVAPGFLLLADQYYPGWQARIDDHPVTIVRANSYQRAVYLPAGEHLVEFSYHPQSLHDGLKLALLGILMLVLLSLISMRRAI